MPRPRFENADPALQRAILEAATREFSQRGYDAASLNRIIEASGLSKGSFYYYFDDKADLAAHVIVDAALKSVPAQALDRVATATDGASFWASFDAYHRDAVQDLLHAPDRLALMTRIGAAWGDHPELMVKAGPLLADLQQKTLAAFRRGQELGVIRDDLPVETLLLAIQSLKTGLMGVFLRGPGATAADLERLVSVLWDLNLRILTPGKKP